MKDARISFCDIEENENPSMVMTYSKDENKYVNIYQINDDNKVTYMAYKQPSEAEYLYNIEKENYNWYIHKNSSTSDSYILLKNIADKLKNNSDKSEKSSNVNIAEIEADYTIKKDEAEISKKTADGNKVTIKKFDQIFVRPEIEPNEQIDFNIDIKEDDLKKSITNVVKNFKKESEKLTNEVKESVVKKVEELKNKTGEMVVTNKKVNETSNMKVTQENLISKLGNHLKYFSANYLGKYYGPPILYKMQDVTGKVKPPNMSVIDEYVYELVGLTSISELENQLKTYLSEEVRLKIKKDFEEDLTMNMREYNGKVYLVEGGIGDGPYIDCDKAKLISSEGNITKVELEEMDLLADEVAAKITLTIKYDEEKSKFLVTDYLVKNANDTQASVQNNSQQTTNNTNNSNNAPDTPTDPNAISKDEALKLAQSILGTKNEENGYQYGYFYVCWIKDNDGKQYYVFNVKWYVVNHWSYINTICVCTDGKTYKEIVDNRRFD